MTSAVVTWNVICRKRNSWTSAEAALPQEQWNPAIDYVSRCGIRSWHFTADFGLLHCDVIASAANITLMFNQATSFIQVHDDQDYPTARSFTTCWKWRRDTDFLLTTDKQLKAASRDKAAKMKTCTNVKIQGQVNGGLLEAEVWNSLRKVDRDSDVFLRRPKNASGNQSQYSS